MKLDDPNLPLRYFIYCRKSTESEDRQQASIPDQLRALTEIAIRENLKIVDVYKESHSAHELGRPKFNNMLDRMKKGEANAILVWHQDRLARNSSDGGSLIYSMDQGFIKAIRTVNGLYRNNADNKSYLGHEFVDSKKFSDHLSELVIRGLNSKVNERHEWPGVAKPGYLNVVTSTILKTNGIEVDAVRFPMLQKIFDLIRTGVYTPLQALHYLNYDLGYRTRITKKYAGSPMPKATFYRVLSDPFYYGLIKHTQGEVMGTHTPMMTKEQFDEVQIRLGKVGKPHQTSHEYPYKEFLRCGECGGSITAQEKWQVRCLTCKTKYHKKNNDSLERCVACKRTYKTPEDYQLLHYVYYGCTKKKTPECSQGVIGIADIEKEIDRELSQFEIRPEFRDWAIKYLNEVSEQEMDTHKVVVANLHKLYEGMDSQINNLMNLFISPMNADKEALSDDEYRVKKRELLTKKADLMSEINKADQEKNKWVELTEKTFDFSCYARYWFSKGDVKTKTEILGTLGKNLIIKDKKLWIDRSNQFYLIEKGKNEVEAIIEKLEPEKRIGLKDNFLSLEEVSKTWRRRRDSNSREPYGSRD